MQSGYRSGVTALHCASPSRSPKTLGSVPARWSNFVWCGRDSSPRRRELSTISKNCSPTSPGATFTARSTPARPWGKRSGDRNGPHSGRQLRGVDQCRSEDGTRATRTTPGDRALARLLQPKGRARDHVPDHERIEGLPFEVAIPEGLGATRSPQIPNPVRTSPDLRTTSQEAPDDESPLLPGLSQLQGRDLNPRPPGYETEGLVLSTPTPSRGVETVATQASRHEGTATRRHTAAQTPSPATARNACCSRSSLLPKQLARPASKQPGGHERAR
jgi:hypothetical protein